MKVAFDIRPALNRGTGVGTFAEQLVLAMDSLPGDHSFYLFTSSLKDRWSANRFPKLHKSEVVDRKWPVKLLNTLWHWRGIPKVDFFTGKVDLAHSPSPLILPTRGKKVITIHDLYFLTNPDNTTGEIRRDYVRLVEKHAKLADGIVAVSQATANDAMEMLGVPKEKIRVCGEDASRLYDQAPFPHELEDIEKLIGAPFFLFVGTMEPRKNLDALVGAFKILLEKHAGIKLVIAGGSGWGTSKLQAELDKLQSQDLVWMSGYRDQRFLRALYHKATAFVMPSHCEGFGLPLVEAMACGCPLIVANNSALPEVAGEAALYWRSGEQEELAELMETLLTDCTVRNDLITAGRKRRQDFSWQKSGQIVLDFYKELTGK